MFEHTKRSRPYYKGQLKLDMLPHLVLPHLVHPHLLHQHVASSKLVEPVKGFIAIKLHINCLCIYLQLVSWEYSLPDVHLRIEIKPIYMCITVHMLNYVIRIITILANKYP